MSADEAEIIKSPLAAGKYDEGGAGGEANVVVGFLPASWQPFFLYDVWFG
jgi:hypothetical protein